VASPSRSQRSTRAEAVASRLPPIATRCIPGRRSAADAPRWRVTEGLGVACKGFFTAGVLSRLAELGHRIEMKPPDDVFAFGGAQLVHRLPGGRYAGGSDPRKGGGALGF
jgi:gamma-glutamyltranspeptidase